MKHATRWFWSIWYYSRHIIRRIPTPLLINEVQELPDILDPRYTYIVGENGYLWFVALKCPCGCGSTISLNLIPEAKPCWKIESKVRGTISLSPSIWSKKGCGSHYFLIHGTMKSCSNNE